MRRSVMLKRKIADLIEQHLKNESERILLIDGARQVGKTYIIRYVGKKLFHNFIEEIGCLKMRLRWMISISVSAQLKVS